MTAGCKTADAAIVYQRGQNWSRDLIPVGLIHPREPTTALWSGGGPARHRLCLRRLMDPEQWMSFTYVPAPWVFLSTNTQEHHEKHRKIPSRLPRIRFVIESPTHFSLWPALGWERHLLQVVGTHVFPRSFRRCRKCPESGNFLSVEPHVFTQWELISSYWLLLEPFPLIWDVFRSPSKLSKSRHPSQPGAPPIGVRPSWSKSDGFSLHRLSSTCLGPLI